MGTVSVDTTEIGTFNPVCGAKGGVFLNLSLIGSTALEASGTVYVDGVSVGTYSGAVYPQMWRDLARTYKDVFQNLDVTCCKLSLGDRDSVTGWYKKSFSESAGEMVVLSKGTSNVSLPVGFIVKLDALGFTVNLLDEGDQVITKAGLRFEVKTVQDNPPGDGFRVRTCDLTLLPLHSLTGETYSESTVEDARYKTKVYLETYLDSDALPSYIVAYEMPDYPLVRVFKDEGVNLVYSIGTPDSAALPVGKGYIENVPITIWCIDKTGISGTKLRWKAEAELRRICEEHPTGGSLFTWQRLGDNEKNLGSTVLYSVEYVMRYKRYS